MSQPEALVGMEWQAWTQRRPRQLSNRRRQAAVLPWCCPLHRKCSWRQPVPERSMLRFNSLCVLPPPPGQKVRSFTAALLHNRDRLNRSRRLVRLLHDLQQNPLLVRTDCVVPQIVRPPVIRRCVSPASIGAARFGAARFGSAHWLRGGLSWRSAVWRSWLAARVSSRLLSPPPAAVGGRRPAPPRSPATCA